MEPPKFRLTASRPKSRFPPFRQTPLRDKPTLPFLPDEIIAMVVNALIDDEYDDDDEEPVDAVPYRDLLSCCLTSKAFLGPARARLYHTALVVVEESDSYVAAGRPTRIRNEFEKMDASTEQHLEATIILNPHLAIHVRKINVIYQARPCAALLVPSLSVTNLFRACPLIHTFTLNNTGFVPTPTGEKKLWLLDVEVAALVRVLQMCRPALSNVNLDVAFESGEGRRALLDAVSLLPTLRKLSFGQSMLGLSPPKGVRAPPIPSSASLTSAKFLDYDPNTDELLFERILAGSWDTLSHLVIRQPFNARPTLPDLTRLSNLATLAWRLDFEGADSVTHSSKRRDLKESLDQLSHLPLTSLYIANSYDAGRCSEDVVDDLSFLPTTLRHLRIPLPSSDILANLLLDDQYAGLRELLLDQGDGESAPADWTPFTLGPLKAACSRRGLRIECDGVLL